MNNSNSLKNGFPVLAYPSSDPTSLCSCVLTFRYHEGRKQATILLKTTLALDSRGDNTFIAQYDADNLSAALVETTSLPSAQRDQVARHADPQMMALSLSLNKPCPLWCPTLDAIAPKAGSEGSFRQLADLAKATAVQIILDYNWIHRGVRGPFEQLVKGQAKLTGFPVGEYNAERGLRLADWTVFGPGDAAAAPPAYKASRKRSSRATESPRSSPPYKRILLEDAAPEYPPPSPTECATEWASSPAPDKPTPTALSNKDVLDFQSAAIDRAVARHLPSALEQVLPRLLPTFFTSPATDSHASQPALTPLGQSLLSHLIPIMQPHLSDLYDDAHYEAECARAAADEEFLDVIEDHKIDLRLIKDDNVDEIQRVATTVLEDARQEGMEWAEELGEEAYVAVRDRIDELTEVRLREWEESKRRGRWRGVKWVRGNWRRRGKGGYRGLGGRWRKAGL